MENKHINAFAITAQARQRTIQSFDRCCSLYYLMMGGLYNSVQSSMVDAQQAIQSTPLYRHQVKQNIRKALAAYNVLEKKIRQSLGDKFQLWLDVTDAIDDDMRHHTRNLFLAVDQHFLSHHAPHHRAMAHMEATRILTGIANATFTQLFQSFRSMLGADISDVFRGGSFADIHHLWEAACQPLWQRPDIANLGICLNDDPQVQLAVDVITTQSRSIDLLNRAGAYALSLNPDQWRNLDKDDRIILKQAMRADKSARH